MEIPKFSFCLIKKVYIVTWDNRREIRFKLGFNINNYIYIYITIYKKVQACRGDPPTPFKTKSKIKVGSYI